jgi:hypothetical protein
VESAGDRGVRQKPGELGLGQGQGGRPSRQWLAESRGESQASHVGKTKHRKTSRGALLAESRPYLVARVIMIK